MLAGTPIENKLSDFDAHLELIGAEKILDSPMTTQPDKLAGVLIRQFFILKHKGKINVLWPAAGVAALGVVAVMIAPQPRQPVAAQPDGAAATKVSFTKVQEIMNARCVTCLIVGIEWIIKPNGLAF